MSERRSKGDGSAPRLLAAQVLREVYARGAFTAAALDKFLSEGRLNDERDRALATEISYGVVRTRPLLEARLHQLAPKGIAGGDESVLITLLIASYQLLFLDRVPAFAVVNLAVDAVTQLRGKKVAGFANAVLRKLIQQPKPSLAEAVESSIPSWLLEQMKQAVGQEAALSLLGVERGGHLITPQCLRFAPNVERPAWAADAEPGTLTRRAWRFAKAGDVRRHPEYEQGQFVVQEEGAMFAGLALGVRPEQRILDVCAGRGQKSSLLAEQLGGAGQLWVSDLSAKKLAVLEREFQRLHLPKPQSVAHDWKQPATSIPKDFDRILVDAPCSGTGTLRRRPEIAMRLALEDVERLASLSEQILRQAAAHLAADGRLVFVVCSVLSRECEEVVERVADILQPVAFDAPEVLERFGEVTQWRLLPSRDETDGFFAACFRRA